MQSSSNKDSTKTNVTLIVVASVTTFIAVVLAVLLRRWLVETAGQEKLCQSNPSLSFSDVCLRSFLFSLPTVYYRTQNARRAKLSGVEIPEADEWEIDRVQLVPGPEIGRGAFGTVRRGVAKDLREDLRGEVP